MKVDSHLHVNFNNLGLRDIISYMDKARIDQCWLLSWEECRPLHPGYRPLPVEDIFDAYEKYGRRIRPMYAPDPGRPDAVESFRQWHERGARGCGELKVAMSWDSDELDPLLSFVNGLGLPLVFHMEEGRPIYVADKDARCRRLLARMLNTSRLNGFLKRAVENMAERCGPLQRRTHGMRRIFPGYLPGFASLDARLRRYRNIKFIGHGPLFWKGVFPCVPAADAEGITCRLMSEHANLYADLSASGYRTLARDPVFAREFLSRFGHKVLYGTDNFLAGLRTFLDSLKLSERTYKQIYGENACSLIREEAGLKGKPRSEDHTHGSGRYENAAAA